jgi:hypothetical protein
VKERKRYRERWRCTAGAAGQREGKGRFIKGRKVTSGSEISRSFGVLSRRESATFFGMVALHRRGSMSKGGEKEVHEGPEGHLMIGAFAFLWRALSARERHFWWNGSAAPPGQHVKGRGKGGS